MRPFLSLVAIAIVSMIPSCVSADLVQPATQLYAVAQVHADELKVFTADKPPGYSLTQEDVAILQGLALEAKDLKETAMQFLRAARGEDIPVPGPGPGPVE